MWKWTWEKMMSSLHHEAGKLGLEVDVGTEDGLTWITIWGKGAGPDAFDALGTMVAQSTGRDFYAHSAKADSICGALDADRPGENDAEPFHYAKGVIEPYGKRFEPSPGAQRYRRSALSEEESALAELFSGPCDPSAQSGVDKLLFANPSLSSARMESVVWEIKGSQKTPPLWWAALAGADPEGWSSWMSVSDSEIDAWDLIDKTRELDEPAKRLKALGEFGIKLRGRSFP